MHIQEALVLMIDAFKQSKYDDKKLLLTLLFQYIENVRHFKCEINGFQFITLKKKYLKKVPQCRSMAVKYAFEIFEQDELESRFLLLLATSDRYII